MRHDGKVLTLQFGKGEYTTYRCQFLTGEATYDACLTEQCLNSRIGRSNSTRMRRRRTTATL